MRRARARTLRAIAAASAVSLLLAACGGDDDGGGSAGPTGGDSPETTAEQREPVRGGTLIYAVEADTAIPWTPFGMACTAACYSTVGRTVYEPLMMAGTDGEYYPYLLESIEANDDFTEWTLVVREGIDFHDGTPLDAAAVADNLTRTSQAPLTGQAVRPIQEITHDSARTVTVRMSTSWPGFNFYLTSQLGLMASPTWLAAVDAGASPTTPVGTGPFRYVSYESGENGNFRAERNPDYWRGDGPNSVTGEGLPYLDAVEVRFVPDSQARTQALRAGDVDLAHIANGAEIAELQEASGVQVVLMDDPGATETQYLLLNQQETLPDGSPNPMADVRVRRALAHATDRETLSVARGGSIYPPANGPFPPGRIGYLEDTGFPEFDQDAARDLLEEVEADTGRPVRIALKTTTDPFNLTTAELLQSMYQDVGFEVGLDQIPQGEFVSEALAGNFQAFTWRNHAGIEPDAQYIWWHSSTTTGIAVNFGRIIDDEVDRLLGIARESVDPDERRQAAEDLNRYFGEQVFNVWFSWAYWGHAHGDHVRNVGNVTIPGAPDGVTALLGGTINPTEIFESS